MNITNNIAISDEAHRYVVQTRHLSESRVAQELVNQVFEIFLPRYRKNQCHERNVASDAALLFPRLSFRSVCAQSTELMALYGWRQARTV